MRNTTLQAKNTIAEERLTPEKVDRLFADGYRDLEILPDGTLRETVRGGAAGTETVTRPLKTERTWY